MIKTVAVRILKPYNRNSEHVQYKSKSDTSKNGSFWNQLKIIQKITRATNIPGRHGIKELWVLRTYLGKYQSESTEHN